MDSNTDLPDDLIPIAEAPRYLPSPRPGKRTALSTVYRKVREGELRCWRQGRWRFVSLAEVRALMQPVPSSGPTLAEQRVAASKQAKEKSASEQAAREWLRSRGIT